MCVNVSRGCTTPNRGVNNSLVTTCLSVCPSVTLVYFIQTAEDIVQLLSLPDIRMIPIFDPERRYSIARGTPFSGGSKCTGVGWKIAIFRLKSPFISETVWNKEIIGGGSTLRGYAHTARLAQCFLHARNVRRSLNYLSSLDVSLVLSRLDYIGSLTTLSRFSTLPYVMFSALIAIRRCFTVG